MSERPEAGGTLKVLSFVTIAIGALLILLAVVAIANDGLTSEAGITIAVLTTGIDLLIASAFIWAAGRALELLHRIAINTSEFKQ